jgi:predicted metalloprotease
MKALVPLILVSLLLFLSPALTGLFPSTPRAGGLFSQALEDGDNADERELVAFIDDLALEIDDFWKEQAPALGVAYRSPVFKKIGYRKRVRGACGKSRGVDTSYCAAEWTVYVDWDSDYDDSILSLWEDGDEIAIMLTLAHEWGHHVQNLLGLLDDERLSDIQDDGRLSDILIEDQADCLMGFFARHARRQGWVERGDLEHMLQNSRESGDAPDTPDNERTHGTPDERAAAFMSGYAAIDAHACGL